MELKSQLPSNSVGMVRPIYSNTFYNLHVNEKTASLCQCEVKLFSQ